MTLVALATYAGVLALAAALPGPAIISIITTGITQGWRSSAAFAFGVAIGDLPLAMLVLGGLAFVAKYLSELLVFIKVAGACYLIWLGVKLWLHSAQSYDDGSAGRRSSSIRLFFTGMGLSLGNPKAVLFHAGMMPILLDLHHVTMVRALTVALIILIVDLAVCFAYAAAAARARGLFRTRTRMTAMNRTAGAALIGAGLVVVTRP
ncbi:LysE family translocator [Sphingobium indicum]